MPVPAGANTRDHTLLLETLDGFTELTELLDHAPRRPALSLDAGYDYQPVSTDSPSVASRPGSPNAARRPGPTPHAA
ncbi:hypothetical protein ABIE67_000215 [Streptomyces sp. V4I8]|uniref:hypothetical protein n=1 Tax=Streptomyces sp. V4I8 TaxID=3156469 RepID=UPI003512E298